MVRCCQGGDVLTIWGLKFTIKEDDVMGSVVVKIFTTKGIELTDNSPRLMECLGTWGIEIVPWDGRRESLPDDQLALVCFAGSPDSEVGTFSRLWKDGELLVFEGDKLLTPQGIFVGTLKLLAEIDVFLMSLEGGDLRVVGLGDYWPFGCDDGSSDEDLIPGL